MRENDSRFIFLSKGHFQLSFTPFNKDLHELATYAIVTIIFIAGGNFINCSHHGRWYIFFSRRSRRRKSYLTSRHTASPPGLEFKRRNYLLNIPERRFFEEVQQIIPAGYVIYPQMLLSKIVRVNSSREEFWSYHNRINRKTVDFVIFERRYLRPVMAIEYDGSTHNRIDRIERDEFVDSVLSSVGIKILHVKHRNYINFEELKNTISQHLAPIKNY